MLQEGRVCECWLVEGKSGGVGRPAASQGHTLPPKAWLISHPVGEKSEAHPGPEHLNCDREQGQEG